MRRETFTPFRFLRFSFLGMYETYGQDKQTDAMHNAAYRTSALKLCVFFKIYYKNYSPLACIIKTIFIICTSK